MRFRNLLLLSFLLAAVCIAAAAQVKLEATGPLKDAAASAEITKALAPDGHRVVLGNGNPLCEIWLVASLPAAPQAKDTEHTNYSGAVSPGALLGVIRFPNGAKDFRGQAIKPGAYSLRYALMPNDGNHMGVAPQRDFLLLVPLGMENDPTPSASLRAGSIAPNPELDKGGPPAIPTAELLKASNAASGTNHPAVFLLLPASTAELPRAYESPEGFVVFAAKVKDVPIALVVKGQAEQ